MYQTDDSCYLWVIGLWEPLIYLLHHISVMLEIFLLITVKVNEYVCTNWSLQL